MSRKIISCPACNARFDVSKYPAGSRVRCGRCNQVLTVPADDGSVPPVKPGSTAGAARISSTGSRGAPAPGAAQPAARVPPREPQRPAHPTQETQVSTPDADPLVDRILHNQYRIVRKLGEGGYGAVYEAKDVNLERRVAIKIMLQSRAQSREYVAKFLREARTAAQLTHPNVVAVHHVGFDKDLGVHFLAMEFVEGRTFHDILQERGPLPVEEACNFVIQSCRGLQAAHEKDIIHRDIKPGNLMLTPGGAVKITDFGLAKIYDAEAAASTVIGTPYFMPPEQFEGKAKDGRTDIYALGVTFYYMLTMQRPHQGAGPAQILLSVMTKEPASVLEHRPDLPEGIWPIVRRMIQRDADKRYRTCDEIIRDLERLQGGGAEEVEQVYCPACGVPNDLDAEKCSGCGESLQEKCPVCGAVDAAGTRFCGDCGANIPLERAVSSFLEEAQAMLQTGRLSRAREKLHSAQERSPQNLRVAQLFRDLEVRREQRDTHRDAVRDLLAQGRPQEALSRWELAKAEFPESEEIGLLEGDIRSALTARDAPGAASRDAVAGAREMEQDGRIREALVAWRGVLVLQPGNEDALQGETRCRERVERADVFAAEATELLRAGDPESALDRLAEASELVPKDPVIEGRVHETERVVKELRSELEAAEAELAAGPSENAVDRLRMLAARAPGSSRVRQALDKAERAGLAASRGAARDRVQRLVAAAQKHEQEHHPRDAAAAWREAVQLDPDSTDAAEGLARAQRAIAEAEALLGQSRSLLSSGDPDGAVQIAQQALEILADDPAAAAQHARAKTSLETVHHEADRIRAALNEEPDDDVLNWARDLANRFPGSALAAQVLVETERVYREAEEKEAEGRAKSLLIRARALEELGQFERAAQTYEEAVSIAPSNAMARAGLESLRERLTTATAKSDQAQARLDAGDPAAAEKLAAASLELIPHDVRASGIRSAAKAAVAEIQRHEQSLEKDATVARAQAQVDRMARLRAKYPASERCATLETAAQAALERAQQADLRNRIAERLAAAEQALTESRLADAEAAAKEAHQVAPDDATVVRVLREVGERRAKAAELTAQGIAAETAGNLAEALRLFSDALGADPAHADASSRRAEVSATIEKNKALVRKAQGEAVQADRGGRPREALAAWERVASLDAKHAKAAAEIARLTAWIEKAEAAIATVTERIEAGNPEAALEAAQESRQKLGAWSEGDDAFRKARGLVDEIERTARQIERDVAAPEGELTSVAERAKSLSEKFPGSTRAKDLAARTATAAVDRHRSIAVSEVRKLVREHRYEDAVARAQQIRADGVSGPELDAAEAQAKKILDDVARLRAEITECRGRGDLEAARDAATKVQSLLHDASEAKEIVKDLEETIREVTARVDAGETARRRGDLTRALDEFREAASLNPGAAALKARIEETSTQQTRRAELIRSCESAIGQGDSDACATTAESLLELFPDDDTGRDLKTTGDALKTLVASLLAHAKRQRELGEHDSANATLETLLRIAPSNAEAKSLRRSPARA